MRPCSERGFIPLRVGGMALILFGECFRQRMILRQEPVQGLFGSKGVADILDGIAKLLGGEPFSLRNDHPLHAAIDIRTNDGCVPCLLWPPCAHATPAGGAQR